MTATFIKYASIGNGNGTNPTGAAGGDLSGTYPNPVVAKLQSRSVSSSAPSTNQVLGWNGSTWIPTTVSSGVVGSSVLTNFIYGFPISLDPAQSSSWNHIIIGFPNANAPLSICRDKADAAFITLAGGTQYTVSLATNSAINGDDSFAGSGTVTNNGVGTWTLTGTSTHFTTDFGTRTCSGTITSSGSTVTGTGTKFLSEFAILDLIGNSAKGFAVVSAIASDTSLTVGSSPPNAFTGQTAVCIEQPTVNIPAYSSSAVFPLATITDDTHCLVYESGAGFSTFTNVVYNIGRLNTAVNAGSLGYYGYTWIVSGGSGTGGVVSTQRTQTYAQSFGGSSGLTGYTTSARRIGSFFLDTSGNIIPFTQRGMGNDRYYRYEVQEGTHNTRFLSNGGAASWTDAVASNCIPPTAYSIYVTLLEEPTATVGLYIRKRGIGESGTTRNSYTIGVNGGATATAVFIEWDGQAIQYASSSGLAGGFIEAIGYVEQL